MIESDIKLHSCFYEFKNYKCTYIYIRRPKLSIKLFKQNIRDILIANNKVCTDKGNV